MTKESVTSPRSCISADIRKQFHEVLEYRNKKTLEEAMGEPSEFSMGMKCFHICPHRVKSSSNQTSRRLSFASLLKVITESTAEAENIANSFRDCGHCPLNPSALDYAKCLTASTTTEHSKNTD
jgi:hypothetical protein